MTSFGGDSKASIRFFAAAVLFLFLVAGVLLALTVVLFINVKSRKEEISTPPTPKPYGFANVANRDVLHAKAEGSEKWSRGFADAARMLIAAMDPSADPCQDFYQFACGNWIRNHPTSAQQPSVGKFASLGLEAVANLSKVLASISDDTDGWPASVKSAAKAYQTCVDGGEQGAPNGGVLLDAIKSFKVGGWPMLALNWSMPVGPNSLTLEALIGQLDSTYKMPTLLSSMVTVDWINVDKNALYIDQGTLGLNAREIYINPMFKSALIAYQNTIVQTSKLLRKESRSTVSDAAIEADAKAIVEYEMSLARKMTADVERRNTKAKLNMFTFDELRKRWPGVNWKDYYANLLFLHNPDYLEQMGRRFNMMEPGYVDELHSDLFVVPSKRVVVNYVIWRFILDNMQFLSKQYKQVFVKLKKQVNEETWVALSDEFICAKLILENMPFAGGYAYVQQHFDKNVRSDISSMVSNVLSAFGQMLPTIAWLDTSSLYEGQKKRSSVLQNVGYPDWMMDVAQLDEYYQGVIKGLQGEPTAWAVTAILKSEFKKSEFRQLSLAASRRTFGMSPALVNAWYQPERNSITFPAAILHPPMYRLDFPKVVNYGAIGVVMGHELSHGFDDQGSQYNWNGTLAPWFSEGSKQGFLDMAQCVISEYNRFCYPHNRWLCVNGRNTQGENIADNGGIQAAFKAFKIWQSLHEPEPSLPGLEQFSAEQIFFLSFGNVWCSNTEKKAVTSKLLTDVHSPARYRVIGSLRNIDSFGMAFNCPRNSPLFPQESDQCHVYRPVPPTVPGPPPYTTPKATASTRPGWKDAAKVILAAINITANPCKNFYEFACGNWVKDNPVPPGKNQISQFSILQELVTADFGQALDNVAIDDPNQPKTLKAAKIFYQSCLQSSESQFPNAELLLKTLSQFGTNGFPIITKNWKNPPTSYNPWSHIAILESWYLVPTLMSSTVTVDWKNTRVNALYIDQGSLLLGNRQFYLNPFFRNTIKTYKAFIVNVAVQLAKDAKADVTRSQIESDAQQIVSFEKRLAKILKSANDKRNFADMFNPFNHTTLTARWRYIDWSNYFFHLTGMNISAIEEKNRLIIQEPNYLDALDGELLTLPMRTLINYVGWRFVYDNLQFLGPGYQKLMVDFKNKTESVIELPPPKELCLAPLLKMMPYAVGRLYVGPKIGPQLDAARVDVAFQSQRIITAFGQMLQSLHWIDDSSKMKAFQKLSSMDENIDYPDWIIDDAQLDAFHQDYIDVITNTSGRMYWTNLFYLKSKYSLKSFRDLLRPPNRRFFGSSPAFVNAWYVPWRNSITFPLAILNSPFYQPDFPQAYNYGGQGATAGHELTHGFDDQGIQFYSNGTLLTWMSARSQKGFLAMADCVVNQYGKYCYPKLGNLCINGRRTQGENMADIGGLRAAYYAYQSYVAAFGSEPRLPGLEEFDMNQIFFIAYATGYCRNIRKSELEKQLIVDVHSPAQWRVNGVLRDIPEFAKTFKCKVGVDPLAPAPQQRCNVW